ncbi:potential fungal zinc cluster transcription factor [Ceraceosorus bombacis]|uniref:Potential fungal zinc cluster transcription factor n=1 Tax=Ceraceosorus bombacis TaxID=401625 RepID=A0A0P1BBL3_9BASI|nr:potential fungal zinc cluster transcription factor [Ceraceosorus bombacis]
MSNMHSSAHSSASPAASIGASQSFQTSTPTASSSSSLRKRGHARRTCIECRTKRTRCDLPDPSVPFSEEPLPPAKTCHRCKTLGVDCIVSQEGLKRQKKQAREGHAAGVTKSTEGDHNSPEAAARGVKRKEPATDTSPAAAAAVHAAQVKKRATVLTSSKKREGGDEEHGKQAAAASSLLSRHPSSAASPSARPDGTDVSRRSAGGSPIEGPPTSGASKAIFIGPFCDTISAYVAAASGDGRSASKSPLDRRIDLPGLAPGTSISGSGLTLPDLTSAPRTTRISFGPPKERMTSAKMFARRPLMLLSEMLQHHEGFGCKLHLSTKDCPDDVLSIVNDGLAAKLEPRMQTHLVFLPALPDPAVLRQAHKSNPTVWSGLLLAVLYLISEPMRESTESGKTLMALIARDAACVMASAPRDRHAIAALELLALHIPLVLAQASCVRGSHLRPEMRVTGEGFISVAISIARSMDLHLAPQEVLELQKEIQALPRLSALITDQERSEYKREREELDTLLRAAVDDAAQWYSLCCWRAHAAFADHAVLDPPPAAEGVSAVQVLCSSIASGGGQGDGGRTSQTLQAIGRAGLAGRIDFLELIIRSWHTLAHDTFAVEQEVKLYDDALERAASGISSCVHKHCEKFEVEEEALSESRERLLSEFKSNPHTQRLMHWLDMETYSFKSMFLNSGFKRVVFGAGGMLHEQLGSTTVGVGSRAFRRRATAAAAVDRPMAASDVVRLVRDDPNIHYYATRWGSIMVHLNELAIESWLKICNFELPKPIRNASFARRSDAEGGASRAVFVGGDVVGIPTVGSCAMLLDGAKSCTESQAATIIGWHQTSPHIDGITTMMSKAARSTQEIFATRQSALASGTNGPRAALAPIVHARVAAGNILATTGLILGAMADAMEEWRVILLAKQRGPPLLPLVGEAADAKGGSTLMEAHKAVAAAEKGTQLDKAAAQAVSRLVSARRGQHPESQGRQGGLGSMRSQDAKTQCDPQRTQSYTSSSLNSETSEGVDTHLSRSEQQSTHFGPAAQDREACALRQSAPAGTPFLPEDLAGLASGDGSRSMQQANAQVEWNLPQWQMQGAADYRGPRSEEHFYNGGGPAGLAQHSQNLPASSAVDLMLASMLGDHVPDWTSLLSGPLGSMYPRSAWSSADSRSNDEPVLQQQGQREQMQYSEPSTMASLNDSYYDLQQQQQPQAQSAFFASPSEGQALSQVLASTPSTNFVAHHTQHAESFFRNLHPPQQQSTMYR